MPPTPSFSISSPLIFGNFSLCNSQLLFGPTLPFTGLNFVFPSIYRNPKDNACKNRTQQLCLHTLPARQREELEPVRSRSEVQTLSHTQSWEVGNALLCPCFHFQKTIIQYSWGRTTPRSDHLDASLPAASTTFRIITEPGRRLLKFHCHKPSHNKKRAYSFK